MVERNVNFCSKKDTMLQRAVQMAFSVKAELSAASIHIYSPCILHLVKDTKCNQIPADVSRAGFVCDL